MIIWSNPVPDPHTAAATAPQQLHFADIGQIVGAIMRMKEQQRAQKEEEQRQLIQGIGQAVGGAAQAYKTYQAGSQAK
jgi:hypothetical protein